MAQIRKPTPLWRRSAVAVAVGLSVMSGTVYAQSNTTGDIIGQVSVIQGTTVVVENVATGVKRTVTPDASGRFVINSLPPGIYKVTQFNGGVAAGTVSNVEVTIGKAREVAFGSTAGNTQVVQVVGKVAQIDVSSSDNSSVFTAKQLENLPLATKDLNGIISLAANTTKADSRYSGGISIGGGAASENSYYINGFPVTNALTQLGSIELPFGAIQQAQVMTGGFGAEFGRSIGGVVNIVTKSGSNEWHGGVNISYEPSELRSKPRNSYYPNTGANDTDGSIYLYRGGNSRSETSYGTYLSGPLVEEKLFFFLAADQTITNRGSVVAPPQSSVLGSAGWNTGRDTNTRYLGKFDWYLTDDHRIEATLLGDNYKTTDDYYGYDYATHSRTNHSYSEYTKNAANITPAVGGDAQILKYSGNITPDLLVTALYGQSESKHKQNFSFLPTSPQIYVPTTADQMPGQVYPEIPANPLTPGTFGLGDGAKEETKSFRFDVEYQLGDHLLRAGLDENRLKSTAAGDSYDTTGGLYYRYYHTSNGSFTGPSPTAKSLIDIGATPVDGVYYYARERYFNDLTNAESNQSAQYIEDRWQVTRNLLLTLGLRNESFENKNGDGQTFLKMDNFLSPRLAAAWDVNGDSSLKIFGSAGRYSLQMPTHVAVRGASRSTYTDRYLAYTGIDPVTGAPTGIKYLSEDPYSVNNEYGQAKDPKTVAATNIRATYQDEVTLGIQKALTESLTGGAQVTYRKLQTTIDDTCDYRPFEKYANDHGIAITNPYYFGCATFNPGKSNDFLVNYSGVAGDYTKVNLSAEDLGFPEAKRSYFAVDLFLEHPLSNGWYGKLTYTYSKSKGNTEGQTRSESGQADIGANATWDTPELMQYAYGPLPNDRTHQIKALGYYQLTPEWGVGGTFVAESGRPKNCLGNFKYVTGDELDGGNLDYGDEYFTCSFDGVTQVITPRGSQGRLPWSFGLDVNVIYKPEWVKGLGMRVDVFNLFNRQTAQVVDEYHEVAYDPTTITPTYGRVISYSAPRKVRLSVQYDF